MTDFANKTCAEFSRVLASKEPVPGGGGAAALVGALGAALAAMVSNLTVGKKKYAEYEEEIKGILQKAEDLRKQLLELMDKDAEAFEYLMKSYSIPKDVPDRMDAIEDGLRYACTAPLDIMRAATETAQLL
ncbi:MAG: cyclodeaminase/cyclohydrolase family protein, partial [Oscillospiraceae bacterium]|nr:cyclodeaminase/cyclohydrolase family protein [Oscillospiraceae bacterium]